MSPRHRTDRRSCGPRLARRAAALLLLAVPLLVSCRKDPVVRDTVTLLQTSEILSTDPNADIEAVTDSVLFNVFEPLVGFDKDLRIQTLLAESWEHPTPERWQFRLRQGVKFHDGTPLTAEVVKEVLTRVGASPQLEASSFLGQIKDVVVVSPHVLEIVTHEPRAMLASLPFLYIAKPGPGGQGLVGTGPYRLREWKRGQSVTLDRYDGYWGRPPAFREARFEWLEDPAGRLRRLRDGSADLVYGVAPEALRQKLDGVRLVQRPGLTVYYLTFNFRPRPSNPFVDARVRQAVHLAIDREALVKDLLDGAGYVATQPVASLVFGFDPSIKPPAHDVARARQLLADAGHPQGFKTRLDIPSTRVKLGAMLRQQLLAVGIDAEIRHQPSSDVYAEAEAGRSDLFFTGWDCSTGEASEFYEFILHTRDSRYGEGNYGLYSNPELDRIAEANAAMLDQRKRQSMLQEAAAITMRDLAVLPLFVEDDIYGVREGLRFEPRADSEVRVADLVPTTR